MKRWDGTGPAAEGPAAEGPAGLNRMCPGALGEGTPGCLWGLSGSLGTRGVAASGGSSKQELLWQRPLGHPGLQGPETQRARQSCDF